MRTMLAVVACVLSLMVTANAQKGGKQSSPSAASAGDDKQNSANYIMGGCRSKLRHYEGVVNPGDHRWIMIGGECTGMVEALVWAARAFEEPHKFCPPDDVVAEQVVRVVVAYVDAVPQRAHEHFLVLALEALRKAWPCPSEGR
jgi:Ssp1 endopeptidase immunity protein Rap1a